MQVFIKIDRLLVWPLWVKYLQFTRFPHGGHREKAWVNQENVIIDTIISITNCKKVIFMNKMNGKTLHLNEEKYPIFLQMRLEE